MARMIDFKPIDGLQTESGFAGVLCDRDLPLHNEKRLT